MEDNFASDSDKDDADYIPDTKSEKDDDCIYDVTKKQTEELANKTKKSSRKRTVAQARTTSASLTSSDNEKKKDIKESDEEERKKSDRLWADFLGGDNDVTLCDNLVTPRPTCTTEVRNTKDNNSLPLKVKKSNINFLQRHNEKDGLINSNLKRAKYDIKKMPGCKIGSALDQVKKRNKTSILEKSKLDWESFKESEGIDSELRTFNKGKSGYLERQDFLQRTDLRQFEIEKDLRANKRRNLN